MISNIDLYNKALNYSDEEGAVPSAQTVRNILANINSRGSITPLEHTYLCQFCISHELAATPRQKQRRRTNNAYHND